MGVSCAVNLGTGPIKALKMIKCVAGNQCYTYDHGSETLKVAPATVLNAGVYVWSGTQVFNCYINSVQWFSTINVVKMNEVVVVTF